VTSVLTALCVLLAVGFFTLLERKVLSYIQYRKGPNKVGLQGIPQPLADAAKLFTKEYVKIFFSNKTFFSYRPMFAMIIILTLWLLYNSLYGSNLKWGILFFLAISRLNVYATLVSGWSSNSKYALLGSVRAVAQTISYEISIAIIILCVCTAVKTFRLQHISQGSILILVIPMIFVFWFITCLAETNRAPFDLAEGESELVSGFNIEYGGALFAFLFIAEYGRILFIRFLTSIIFFTGIIRRLIPSLSLGTTLFTAFAFLWVRGTYPRMRYDQLMSLTWKAFLPISLIVLVVAYLI